MLFFFFKQSPFFGQPCSGSAPSTISNPWCFLLVLLLLLHLSTPYCLPIDWLFIFCGDIHFLPALPPFWPPSFHKKLEAGGEPRESVYWWMVWTFGMSVCGWAANLLYDVLEMFLYWLAKRSTACVQKYNVMQRYYQYSKYIFFDFSIFWDLL